MSGASPGHRLGLIGVGLLLLLAGGASLTRAEECKSADLVIDTAGSTKAVLAMWGMSPGQTFVANDTIVHSITVWRKANQTPNASEMRLIVTGVDSTGRPRGERILYWGSLIAVTEGDGIHPIEIRFEIEPPLRLPYRGKFAFFIQHQCSYFFDLLTRNDGAYPAGELWRTESTNYDGCEWRSWVNDRFADLDLCCRIEFCGVPTPVRKPSWGRVKSIYR